MAYNLLILSLFFAVHSQVYSNPIGFLQKFNAASTIERNWIWGWAWGAESTVSIVDRSPPLQFSARPAAFGAELTDPLLGYVIPLSSFTTPCSGNITDTDAFPNLGCPKLCVTHPNEPERTDTWIALVQRGKCPFVAKVREAQRLGANAVVVGGDDPLISGNQDVLVNMYSEEDASDVTIASTFIKFSDYTTLSALISASNTSHSGMRTLSLLITTEYSAWEWYSPVLTFLIILLLPSSLTFLTLFIHRIRAARAAQRDRAPEDIVKNLPWRVWTGTGWEKHEGVPPGQEDESSPPSMDPDLERGPNDDNGSASRPEPNVEAAEQQASGEQPWFETQSECAICLSDFAKGDRVRVLPCHHIFHIDEVDEWLIHRKKLCPVCKADVTQPSAPAPHPTVTNDETTGTNTDAPYPVISHSRPLSPASTSSNSPSTERTPLLPDHHYES